MATFEIKGGSELLKVLRELERRGADLHPAMELIANRWKNLVRLQFRTGGAGGRDPWGNPWKGNLRGGTVLRDTGRLLGGILHDSDKTTAEVGTNVCYAIVHQTGATIKAGQPPHQSLCGYRTKGSPVLRFRIGRNGPWVSKKQVTIPRRAIFPDERGGGLPRKWSQDAAKLLLDYLQSGRP